MTPTVSVLVPVLNEAEHLHECLSAVMSQTYPVLEVLVADGGSTDGSPAIAKSFHSVRVLANPRRNQAAGLNIGLRAARGDIAIRVDGHCTIEPDYVERCVIGLSRPGVVMVGGAMRPVGRGSRQRGIAAAMTSHFGAGPARFHVGGPPGWVDTVYLGAYRREDALSIGGYDDAFVANEDAEFAYRMRSLGGIWFDPSIRSAYQPRAEFRQLARQFFRYGRGRASTVRRHPRSLSPRQLAAPALLVALTTRWRRRVSVSYLGGILLLGLLERRRDGARAAAFAASLPVMHSSWGMGFFVGIVHPYTSRRPAVVPAAG